MFRTIILFFSVILISQCFTQVDEAKVCNCGEVSKVVMYKLSSAKDDEEKERIHTEYKEVMDACAELLKNASEEEKQKIKAIAKKCLDRFEVPEKALFYGVSQKDSLSICNCVEIDLNKNKEIKLAGADSTQINSVLNKYQPFVKQCTELYNSLPGYVVRKAPNMWEHCERMLVRKDGFLFTKENICMCIEEAEKHKQELDNCNCEEGSEEWNAILKKNAKIRDKCERMAYNPKESEVQFIKEALEECNKK